MSNEAKMVAGTPDAEVDITRELIRHLLGSQHPDLADLPLQEFASGWDNQLYRLGSDLLIRLPRRELGARLIRNEQIWLPQLAEHLPLPVPLPRRLGVPDENYPWHWNIVDYLPGTAADQSPPTEDQASRWAEFLRALHSEAPEDAPVNEVRGVPLVQRQSAVEGRMDRLADSGFRLSGQLLEIWHAALQAPDAESQCWLHGDLHALNVLTEKHTLSAVIDWGDITSGDVATDLASIWTLFTAPSAREGVLRHYQPDQATLDRARGWALSFGVILLDSGLINSPRHAAMGRATLSRLEADGPQT
jgi:aminoglycoside phosphotransferase (APT) family kinase protein